MKRIKLTQGQFAIVDDEDFERVSQWKWRAVKARDTFYAIRCIKRLGKRTTSYLHRLIMNTPDGLQTDHINGNGLDNRKENLRFCSAAENRMNTGKQKNNKSGFKGVSWHKASKKWKAVIKVGREILWLGLFVDKKLAADVYDKSARKFHGKFAKTNF